MTISSELLAHFKERVDGGGGDTGIRGAGDGVKGAGDGIKGAGDGDKRGGGRGRGGGERGKRGRGYGNFGGVCYTKICCILLPIYLLQCNNCVSEVSNRRIEVNSDILTMNPALISLHR